MKKITLLISFIFCVTQIYAQNRQGNIFYSTVEKTDSIFNISVDLYDAEKIKYIKIQLVDESKTEFASDLAELIFRDDKYYLNFKNEEKRVEPENINLTLKNEYNDIKYPQINIKLMDKTLRPLDYSQKVFY